MLLRYHAKDIRGFRSMVKDPELAQRKRFQKLVGLTSHSEFGEAFGVHKLQQLEDIQQIPIQRFSDYRPWIDRIASGEMNILSKEPTTGFMETSGTTGSAKWIPVTASWQRSIQLGQRLWLLQLLCHYPQLTHTKTLSIVSSASEQKTIGGIPVGANTGRMKGAQPFWAKGSYSLPDEIHAIKDPSAKVYATVRVAMQAPIGLIVTANPSMVLRYSRAILEWKEELSIDLRHGTLREGPASLIEEHLRRKIEQTLAPASVPLSWRLTDVWPLQVISCWKGGPATYFVDRLKNIIGPTVPIQEIGITASEGFFSLALGNDLPGDLFWAAGHVVEFMDSNNQSHFCWSLNEGERYRLVISTENGLWRYDLQDTVEVTGFIGRLPLLRFVGKSGRFLNAVGEKISEAHISELMLRASQQFKWQVEGFTARTHWDEVPKVILAVEPKGNLPKDCAMVMDTLLQDINPEYKSKRTSERLLPLEIETLPEGTYRKYRKNQILSGAPDGQIKDFILALSDDDWNTFMGKAVGQ
ncbi:MAG: GH3 auxin-responsive promoter family protein [Myxococcota bacterium]